MESRGILLQLSNSVCLGERLAAILRAVGVAITDQEIIDIEKQRSESLRSHGLLEFDSSALEMLFTSLGQSSVFPNYHAVETACDLIELYYALRSSCSSEVGDIELIEELVAAFEASEGAVELIDFDALTRSFRDLRDVCGEVVDGCGLCNQDSSIWEYDEFSTGWDGEEWGSDHDE